MKSTTHAPCGQSDSAAPLGLYVHIPFCAKKCPYCDFNTYAGQDDTHRDMVEALCAEMARWSVRLGDRQVTSVFVGGGTPTVLDAGLLHRLFDTVHTNFQLVADCEITSEANPGTVDSDKFAALREAGVTRLSLGAQSFQPEELNFLGRAHGTRDIGDAFAAARAAGFDNINLDFMLGLPGQTPTSWRDTLCQALSLAPDHLSLYSLIVEPSTPLHHWVASGRVAAPDEGRAALLYEMAIDLLQAHGYVQYEVSNWAKRESTPVVDASWPTTTSADLACQHNLLYWRNDDYLGIGPGAHSHFRCAKSVQRAVAQRWANRKSPRGYIRRIMAGDPVHEMHEEIEPRLSMGETMMLGLRLVQEGVSFARFSELHQRDLRDVFASELDYLQAWNLIELSATGDPGVRLTPRGLMVGNQVFLHFLPDAAGDV